MKRGFTTKEFIIALIAFAIILLITIPLIIRAYSSSEKAEILNFSKLYIKKLNTAIITSQIDDSNKVYNIEMPSKKGETITFKINNFIMENPQNYSGIIKITYINDNEYDYKIAIHNNDIMIGTEDKPISYNMLDEDVITKYNKKTFSN